MIFGGLQRTSTIDFPGVLSCVLFSRGCDMNCFYCHNRELIQSEGPTIQEAEILRFLEKRRGLLDGVVISGGEPTLQRDLPEFLKKVRALGYRLKLDTNGQRPDEVENLLDGGLLDYVALDVKALPEDYASVCGMDGFARAVETVKVLSRRGVPFEARTTLYPGMGMEQLTKLLESLPKLGRWRLNLFHMPELFLPKDQDRLECACITAPALEAQKSRLLELQPGLIW